MNTSNMDRHMVFFLCCISFWSTAVITNAYEEKANQIIKLWPKDAARRHEAAIVIRRREAISLDRHLSVARNRP